jgi:hypothetical protein
MSTVTVNINALYTLYLDKIVQEFGRKTKPENFAVAEFSTLDLERIFKIRDLENLVSRDTKVIIQHSSGQLYLVDTQVLKEPINIIKQCGDLNKFYDSMHRKLMNEVKEEEHKQKFVEYGALHLAILRFFIYTHGSKQVARIISNKMIMGQNLIARLGFKFLFGRSLIYQKIEKFRQVPMKLNNMELMTVLSLALVYNGQELKKYQQMLIKENISLDSFVYQLIKVEQTEENTKQDNTKQNDQDNTKQNDQDNTKQNDQNNTEQNDQNNTKQNDQDNTEQNDQNNTEQNDQNNTKQNDNTEQNDQDNTEQMIRIMNNTEQNDQDNTKQNDQDNTEQNDQDNTKQNNRDNIKQNNRDNIKQNDRKTTPKQNTENETHLAAIAALAVVGIASVVVVGHLIMRFIEFIEYAFTSATVTLTSMKILILVAVIALAYIFRNVPLYWITVKALKEQKKQQQQDDRQNRDRRDRFNENREHRNYYKQKYQEHEQKYNQLVNQKIETLPRLVIVST